MNFRVESRELSIVIEEESPRKAALKALKTWHAAEERIHLCGVLTVKAIGPRDGMGGEEVLFSTFTILDELNLKFITTDGELVIVRPQIVNNEEMAG